MGKAHPEPVWHLSRRDERPCVLSNRELLLLAERGHLRGDDMLWRRDFDGWKTVRSLLGHVTGTPSPSSISAKEDPLLPRQKHSRRGDLESDPGFRTLHAIATSIGYRVTAPFAGRWKLAGLLVALFLAGVLGIAIDKLSSIDTQFGALSSEPHSTAIDRTSSNGAGALTAAQQPNEPHTQNIAERSNSIPQAKSQEGIIVRKVTVLSIDASEASDASILGPSDSVSVPLPNPADRNR